MDGFKTGPMSILCVFIFLCGVQLSLCQNPLKFEKHEKGEKNVFRFASYYASHMVLQRAPQAASLWGYAAMSDIGKEVGVAVIASDKTYKSYMGHVAKGPFSDRAVWIVALSPTQDTKPFVITAKLSGYQPLVLSDVLFGDVWLCSGQSNMQFTISQMFGKSREIEEAKTITDMRLFNVERVKSKTPLYDLDKIIFSWTPPSEEHFEHAWQGFSAVCYMFGKHLKESLGYPIGLIDSTWGGTRIECWSSPEALAACGLHEEENGQTPVENPTTYDDFPYAKSPPPEEAHVLWNAMIHPFVNMTIKGAIWYQGEANTKYNTDYYNCTFPSMIKDWRKYFSRSTEGRVPDDMPFGFVQIGPVLDVQNTGNISFGYPMIRYHQMGDNSHGLQLENTFMAVAMDLYDPISPFGSVHIRDKPTVARRLAHAALNNIYAQGPSITNFPIPTLEVQIPTKKRLMVQFMYGAVQINIRNYDGFEICCASDYSQCSMNSTVNWIPSPITQKNETTIWLSYKLCPNTHVSAYRYAWRSSPCPYHRCAIYSDFSGDPLPTYIQCL